MTRRIGTPQHDHSGDGHGGGAINPDEYNNVVAVDPAEHGGDLGAALNAARADGHFSPAVALDVAPGEWLISTPVDWTAQGAADAPKGPDVDFTGVWMDPDVGAGNHCFERIGVKMMDCYGGHVELVNGSGCETVILDGRDNAGARPRLNRWYGLTCNDAGAATSAYHNVGAPRIHFESPTFIEYNGEAACIYGSSNVDGVTSTHTTLNGTPNDSAQCSFSDPDFSMHGTGGRAVVRTGGRVPSLSFSGNVYYQSNQDAIPGHQFVDNGQLHERVGWGNVTMEHLGSGFAPMFEVVAGHTSNIERLSLEKLNGDLDTTQTDGKVYDDKEGMTLIGFYCPQMKTADGLRARGPNGSIIRDVRVDGRYVRGQSGTTIDAARAGGYSIHGHDRGSQSIGTDEGGWCFTTGAKLQAARLGQIVEFDPLNYAVNFGTAGARIYLDAGELKADDEAGNTTILT